MLLVRRALNGRGMRDICCINCWIVGAILLIQVQNGENIRIDYAGMGESQSGITTEPNR